METIREAHRVRKGFEAACGNQQVNQRLFLIGILGRARVGLRDTEPVQRCARSIQPRLPGNMRLIELGCEPRGLCIAS